VLDRHGSPQTGIHAIQVEVDRRCYLTAAGEPGRRFDEVAALLETLATRLGALLLERRLPQAAE
jgi:N-formylglutamate amidohydrolase